MNLTLEKQIEQVWNGGKPIEQWKYVESDIRREYEGSPDNEDEYFQCIYDTECLIKENMGEALSSKVQYVRRYAEYLLHKGQATG